MREIVVRGQATEAEHPACEVEAMDHEEWPALIVGANFFASMHLLQTTGGSKDRGAGIVALSCDVALALELDVNELLVLVAEATPLRLEHVPYLVRPRALQRVVIAFLGPGPRVAAGTDGVTTVGACRDHPHVVCRFAKKLAAPPAVSEPL